MSSSNGSGRGMTPEQMREAIATLSSPDRVESRSETSTSSTGCPAGHGVDRLRRARPDARHRGVPQRGARRSLVAMRNGLRSVGVTSPRAIGFTDPRANSGALFLTPNTETTYGIDVPRPEGVGADGDRGAAAVAVRRRRLLVPLRRRHGNRRSRPGRGRQVPVPAAGIRRRGPDGYFVYRTPTFTNLVVLRALGGVPAIKQTRIYPLAEAAAPGTERVRQHRRAESSTPCTPTTSPSSRRSPSSCRRSRSRPSTPSGPASSPPSASSHGQPFAPDDRLRGILEQAAPIGAGMARAIAYQPRDPEAVLYGSWKNAFVGGSYEFLRDGARLLDARTQFHYLATVITPAMAHAQVGAGSAYAYTVHDANGDLLDGGRTYRLHVDADPPAKNFWAVDIYDTQTRSLLAVPSTPYPALASNAGTLQAKTTARTTSTSARPHPRARSRTGSRPSPASRGSRSSALYGPLEPWFDQTWTLNEFEPIG